MPAFLKNVLIACLLFSVTGGLAVFLVERARTEKFLARLEPDRGLSAGQWKEAVRILDRRLRIFAKDFSLSRWQLEPSGASLDLKLYGQKRFRDIVPFVCRRGLFELRLVADWKPAAGETPAGYSRLLLREELLDLMNLRQPIVRETTLLVKDRPELVCPRFKNARFETRGFLMKNIITLDFTDQDAKKFAEITEKNVGRQLAVVIDNEVKTAPKITGKVGEGRVQLLGIRVRTRARQMAEFLKAGALPAGFSLVAPPAENSSTASVPLALPPTHVDRADRK